MKHIKTFKKYSLIGEDIIIVEPIKQDKISNISKDISTENIRVQNIGKDIIKVIPGKDKVAA